MASREARHFFVILKEMKPLVVANWKMNPASYKEARRLFDATKKAADIGSAIVIVAPPTIYLRELRMGYKGARLLFAAQTAHFEAGGAHTGDVSIQQLKDARVSYVLVGHAERRAAGETNDDVRQKASAAIAANIPPIVCVGESRRSGDGEHFRFVKEQLRAAFTGIPQQKVAKVIVAYEPLWAIGATQAMSPRDMHEMSIFIRKTVVEMCGDVGHKVKILYGGAIDEANVAKMIEEGDVSGLLVGRASQDGAKFTLLLKALANA